MRLLNNEYIFKVLRLAREAAIDPDRYGMRFIHGTTTDESGVDGGPPDSSTFYPFFLIHAGGLRVMSSDGGIEIDGPWCTDLTSVLNSIEEEALNVIQQREAAEYGKSVRDKMIAKNAEERRLLDAISLYEQEKWTRP